MAKYEIISECRRYKEKISLLPSIEIFRYGKSLYGIEFLWFVFSFIVIAVKKFKLEVEEDG